MVWESGEAGEPRRAPAAAAAERGEREILTPVGPQSVQTEPTAVNCIVYVWRKPVCGVVRRVHVLAAPRDVRPRGLSVSVSLSACALRVPRGVEHLELTLSCDSRHNVHNHKHAAGVSLFAFPHFRFWHSLGDS